MITIEQVEKVAHLSRLTLTAEEKETFTAQLNKILEAADKLKGLNTDDVEPMSHAFPLQNIFREDVALPSMARELIMQNAPDPVDGAFRVPSIMGEDE